MSSCRILLASHELRAAVISFAAIAWLRGPSSAAPSALPDVPCDSRAATGPSLQERDSGSSKRADGAIRIVANDNRSPGGTLRHGVLTLRLNLCRGRWFPEADTGPSEIVLAFAEVGHRPQIPGPLIRVPAGTLIRAFVRNTLRDSTLVLRGFHTPPGLALDTIQVGPGSTSEVSFAAGGAGDLLLLGSTAAEPLDEQKGGDSQLYGLW